MDVTNPKRSGPEQPPNMDVQIITPLGWGAGKSGTLQSILYEMSMDMQAYRSQLQEKAAAEPERANTYQVLAEQMERYATALWLVHWQTLSQAERDSRLWSVLSVVKSARKHGIALPPDLEVLSTGDDR